MTIRFLCAAAAAAALAAPAAAQAPQGPPAAPPALSADRDGTVFVVTETHRGEPRDGERADAVRPSQTRVYTLRTDGGTYAVRDRDGDGIRERGDGELFVLRAREGDTFRVKSAGDGILVLEAKDGRTYRVRSGEPRVFRIGTAMMPRRPLVLREEAWRERCGGERPLVDRTRSEEGERT